jgi:diadenosine tetraphosphate (Ap4A) HIT family hydrolase
VEDRRPKDPSHPVIVGQMTTPAQCYTCVQDARGADAPVRERIASDEFWRAAHAFNSALPGWLVLVPRRHVTSLADLTDPEAASLGCWQVRMSRALQQVVGCQKTYLVQFAEADGFSHVHFHVIPRQADLPPELRGPRVFQLLGAADRPHVSNEQVAEISSALASVLRAG